jgi:hypothetical protein
MLHIAGILLPEQARKQAHNKPPMGVEQAQNSLQTDVLQVTRANSAKEPLWRTPAFLSVVHYSGGRNPVRAIYHAARLWPEAAS